jgi:hypothetical protein
VGAEVRAAGRLLAGLAAVEVGEDGAAGVARGGEADEAPGGGEVDAVHLAGHLDVEHALAVRRVRAVVHHPPPVVHARDAHHAACGYTRDRLAGPETNGSVDRVSASTAARASWTRRRCAGGRTNLGLAWRCRRRRSSSWCSPGTAPCPSP